MKPVTPVLPGVFIPDHQQVIFAKDQSQYKPLPAVLLTDGEVITRWSFSWRERLKILFGGSVWLTIYTFNQPLQPIYLDTASPTPESKG